MFGALIFFELGGRWRCRGDRDGEANGDGRGDVGKLRYLKEDGDIEINM
jgi:hypothetical protein